MHRGKTPSLSLREESSYSVHQACSYLPRAAPCSAGGWLHTQVAPEKSLGCAEGQCPTALSQPSSGGKEERGLLTGRHLYWRDRWGEAHIQPFCHKFPACLCPCICSLQFSQAVAASHISFLVSPIDHITDPVHSAVPFRPLLAAGHCSAASPCLQVAQSRSHTC